ncbi:scopoletin glucosyltransferase-like [Triticum dicoccoides]|nr:scopoletin glucosyltransferase-like [Triticum dicoccoides]
MADKDEEQQQQQPLHILFFPFLIPGHLIPMADIAVVFAARGVRCTILTTPVQASIIGSIVDRANSNDDLSSQSVHVAVVPFPDVGLPPAGQRGTGLVSQEDKVKFGRAVQLLREPFERFLADSHADLDAVVSDGFYHWSVDVAAEYGVPRLMFLGMGVFARSCSEHVLSQEHRHNPDGDDPDAVVSLPGLPHGVELRRSQMMKEPHYLEFFRCVYAAGRRSYGELFNSFQELERDSAEHYRTMLGGRAWFVGPVALASGSKDVASRGTDALSLDADGCLRWLDSKPAGSVAYVAFGTLTSFSPEQLRELARGLDISGKNFVWVISGADAASSDLWMPEGFQTASRGYIIRGWAPQVLILNHPAMACFVTHCGWNSTLEAVSAGVPMMTWPRYADQFFNEKLVVDVLKVGVSVGARDNASSAEAHQVIGGGVIAKCVTRLMEVQGDVMRKKVEDLGVKARDAVEKGGSSYGDVGRLVDDLKARRSRQRD